MMTERGVVGGDPCRLAPYRMETSVTSTSFESQVISDSPRRVTHWSAFRCMCITRERNTIE